MSKKNDHTPSIEPLLTLVGHLGNVNWVEVYASGRRALSASDDKTLKVWDLDSGRLLVSLEGHSYPVVHAVVYAQERRALSASEDSTLKVWDLDNGSLLHSLEGHSNLVRHAVVYAEGKRALSASEDKTLKVWDLDNGSLLHSLEGHSRLVRRAVVYAEGKRALSASDDKTLKVWDLDNGSLLHSLEGHSRLVRHAVVYAEGKRALSASDDKTLKIWDLDSGHLLHSLEGHSHRVVHAVVYAEGKRALSSSEDSTLKVWDLDNGSLLHSLEGHSNRIMHTIVYAEGKRVLSASDDKTLKVWDLDGGRLLHSFEGHRNHVVHAVVYAEGKRALSASWDNMLKVWDLAALESLAVTERSAHYINAKVVLIGDSGVGKSGLRLVLEGKPFEKTESTHGRHVTTFETGKVPHGEGSTLYRETLLWDLAGQPGYRLIHQLHLRDVAIALVIFDAKSETDPFAGVRHWERALRLAQKAHGSSGAPLRKFLIAARMDRGGIAVSRERIEALCRELEFERWFETSALEGLNIPMLAEAIRAGIPWDQMATVVSTELFRETKRFLVETKESGRVLVEEMELFRSFTKDKKEPIKPEEFGTCVDRLRDAGLIRRLAFGDLLLLQPEILDNYASALVNAARQQPDGFGCIREDDVLAGKFDIPKGERLESKAQEKLLLIAMVNDLLAHEIALREPCKDGMLLIFPSQFTRENPDLPDPAGKSSILEFEGPVMSVYTTLAVRLAQSGTFKHEELWKNAVTYKPANTAGQCGLFLSEIEEGKGRLTLFHAAETPFWARELFEGFVLDHLKTHALPETIRRRRIIVCPECATPVNEAVAKQRLDRGLADVICSNCEVRISLIETPVIAEKETAGKLRVMGQNADENRNRSAAAAIIKGKRETNDFDVFLSYRTPDRPAVKIIGEQLIKQGILPWLDEWEIQPGQRWVKVLQNQITNIKSMAVFLGNEKLERYQEIEVEEFIQQFVNRNCTVIPAILSDAKAEPEMPPFLSGFHAVDFRKPDPDPIKQLIWGITGKRAAPDDFRLRSEEQPGTARRTEG